MYFFNGTEETSQEDIAKIMGSDTIMERAYHELDRYYWNEEELLSYEQAQKYEWGYNASMEQKFDEGEQIGIAKGEQIGIAKEKIEIAKAMLQKNMGTQIISEIIGLPVAEIESLKP